MTDINAVGKFHAAQRPFQLSCVTTALLRHAATLIRRGVQCHVLKALLVCDDTYSIKYIHARVWVAQI